MTQENFNQKEYREVPRPNTEESRQLIPAAIIIAGALIAGAIYMGGSKPENSVGTSNNGTPSTDSLVIEKISSRDHILGNQNAKVVVVEYSDLECPFCKAFHSTMHQIMDTYSDDEVAWVYRHFPIASLHSKAPKEAEATECAAELGGNSAFWAYTDRLIEKTESNNRLDLAQLPIIAGEIGLDVESFTQCLDSGKYTEAIKEDVVAAAKAGARGTPYSVIITKDGKKVVINGAESFASIKAKIDTLIK